MALTEKQLQVLRRQLGLAETATAEDVVAALDAAAEAEAQAEADAAAEAAAEAAAAALPATVTEPTPSVNLSAANFAQMKGDIARLTAQNKVIVDAANKERRDKAVFSAVQSGVLHDSESALWRASLDRDEEGTMTLLSARHPMFPTSELGAAHAPHAIETNKSVREAQFAADDEFFGGK